MQGNLFRKITYTAFRAGSLRGVCLMQWRGAPHLVYCFGDQWRADWFLLRWQRTGALAFVSRRGSFCVAIPAPAVKFPFPSVGLVCGPADQWRKWVVAGGVERMAQTLRNIGQI